jgi:hypothetical protein
LNSNQAFLLVESLKSASSALNWESRLKKKTNFSITLWPWLKDQSTYLSFLSPDLCTTLPPRYSTNLAILFTYILSLPTNYNHPLPLYPSKVNFFFFGKTSISSWLNLYLLTKLFPSLVKPLFLSKNFLLHG